MILLLFVRKFSGYKMQMWKNNKNFGYFSTTIAFLIKKYYNTNKQYNHTKRRTHLVMLKGECYGSF